MIPNNTHYVADTAFRDMAVSHYSDVLEIEAMTFDSPYTRDDLQEHFWSRGGRGFVIEVNNQVAAYVLAVSHKAQIDIERIAVAETLRHRGLGTQLMNYLVRRLVTRERCRMCAELLACWTPANGLFRKFGLRAKVFDRQVGGGVGLFVLYGEIRGEECRGK